jgi:uncharacterized NAD(P)/FAD-binding protein YdhS
MLQLHIPQIAIIGGGFSGAMVATHLLRHATQPLHIKLIESRTTLGQGTAYSTGFDCHLLNVPAGKMSAFADLPDHFVEWLQHRGSATAESSAAETGTANALTASTFVSRRLYGEYIQSVLADAQRNAKTKVKLDCLQDEADAIYPYLRGAAVYLKSGRVLRADQVVLALGNFPPANPPVDDSTFYQSSRYVGNPWSSQALTAIDLDQPLLLIGSGLTMVDWAVALHQRGFRSTLHVISRRGLLPQSHRVPSKPLGAPDSASAYALTDSDFPQTTRLLLRWLRQEVELAQQQGSDWRSVIDALRPHTQTIWQGLSLSEQQRFLRHVRPYWEVHRHRVAPQVAETIHHLRQTGQMQLWSGRIQSYQEQKQGVEICFRLQQGKAVQRLFVSKVINCTGSECNYRKSHHPLVKNLLQAGLILPDPLDLGLQVATNGALIAASGQASSWLFTLGSAQKGSLWETTAIPELRQQAATLAQSLLKIYQSSCSESYQISRSKSFKYSNAL